jgi:NADH dehydrogenase/NADH:ubiquinone oxidoreductase subunit G
VSVAITVDGRAVECGEGQTLAAALISAGIPAWRTTRRGHAARGLFCGIGVCFDCLVTVNGAGPLRACLVSAQPGDEVSTDPAHPALADDGGPRA